MVALLNIMALAKDLEKYGFGSSYIRQQYDVIRESWKKYMALKEIENHKHRCTIVPTILPTI